MSYKTTRLVNLFPDAYAVQDTESLLYRTLDALGSQLFDADQHLKALLKSHWIEYAEGQALDGLGSIYGVTRRRLPDGIAEPDDSLRQRLRSIVTLFQGGGTVAAIKGAVRSALGLPLNFNQLNLPPGYEALRQDLEDLITLEEFSPEIEVLISSRSQVVAPADAAPFSQSILEVSSASARAAQPQIEWTFGPGGGHRLRIERLATETSPAQGIKATDDLGVPAGAQLVLFSQTEVVGSTAIADTDDTAAQSSDRLIARLVQTTPTGETITDVSNQFTNLDGSRPARLPAIPRTTDINDVSRWDFRATGGLFDVATFDADTFDQPDFAVQMRRVRFQPLTFEVRVPYLIQDAVQALAARHGYTGNLFIFQGLAPEQIPVVVAQTQAAGVNGRVNFSLNLLDIHDHRDRLQLNGDHHATENANATDALEAGSFNRTTESHNARDRLAIGGLLDLATFDTNFGFF
ncbi:MAG: hypothetical protein ACFBSF_08305 [Leptolyngbyaceae cyanobacterium]